MGVRYSVTVNDASGALGGNTAALSANVGAAMEIWGRYLSGYGGANIEIVVNVAETTPGAAATGGPGWVAYKGQYGTASLFETGAARELRTGFDQNGSSADITINVPPSFLTQSTWLDPTPLDFSDTVPYYSYDGLSIFLHEIGHGLGMVGWYDVTTNTPSSTYLSTYDQNVVQGAGRLWFTGENTQRTYGGGVPLTSQSTISNVYHYGDAQLDMGNTTLLNGLMNRAVMNGTRYQVGQVDLAILRDTGLRTFDPLRYIASNGDLIRGYGADAAAGLAHFSTYGHAEGRATERFSAHAYLASNPDLLNGYGVNATLATDHYIRYGYYEGRGIGFDATAYLASNTDLLTAFGADADRGARHWLEYGRSESRSVSSFDAAGYLARYGDLRTAFGTDLAAATRHYVESGYWEGRRPPGAAAALASAVEEPAVTPPPTACACGFCGGAVAGLPATLAAVV